MSQPNAAGGAQLLTVPQSEAVSPKSMSPSLPRSRVLACMGSDVRPGSARRSWAQSLGETRARVKGKSPFYLRLGCTAKDQPRQLTTERKPDVDGGGRCLELPSGGTRALAPRLNAVRAHAHHLGGLGVRVASLLDGGVEVLHEPTRRPIVELAGGYGGDVGSWASHDYQCDPKPAFAQEGMWAAPVVFVDFALYSVDVECTMRTQSGIGPEVWAAADRSEGMTHHPISSEDAYVKALQMMFGEAAGERRAEPLSVAVLLISTLALIAAGGALAFAYRADATATRTEMSVRKLHGLMEIQSNAAVAK